MNCVTNGIVEDKRFTADNLEADKNASIASDSSPSLKTAAVQKNRWRNTPVGQSTRRVRRHPFAWSKKL